MITFDADTTDDILDAVIARWGSAAVLRIYAGPQPVRGEAVDPSDLLLAELTFDSPAGVVTTHTAVFTVLDDVGVGDGRATWARVVTSGGDYRADVTVSDIAFAADVTLNTADIGVGVPVSVTSAILSTPHSPL